MLSINKCPVCGAQNQKDFISCKDYTVSSEVFKIRECCDCGFKFTNPRPENERLGDYYKSEDYISHSNTNKGIISKLYHAVRNYTLGKKEDLLRSYVSRGTLIDYGCGTGMFLNHCKSKGWTVVGMEPDPGARKMGQEMGLDIFQDKLSLAVARPNIQVDAITLWHVLEHVTDLTETLSFFKNALKKEGVLIIAVPNHTSHDARHYGEHWAAYDVPRHLYHFEKKTAEALLSNNGFRLIKCYPMKFDSFYVSMLSEKYRTGSISYPKAFIQGLLSNLKAKSAENYSSVIYVFKHK